MRDPSTYFVFKKLTFYITSNPQTFLAPHIQNAASSGYDDIPFFKRPVTIYKSLGRKKVDPTLYYKIKSIQVQVKFFFCKILESTYQVRSTIYQIRLQSALIEELNLA